MYKGSNDPNIHIFVEAFVKAIEFVKECTIRHAPETLYVDPSDRVEKYEDYYTKISHDKVDALAIEVNASDKDNDIVMDLSTGLFGGLSDIDDLNYGIILQPRLVDDAVIKRFGEVGIKFLFTDKIIMPQGIVIGNDAKDKK